MSEPTPIIHAPDITQEQVQAYNGDLCPHCYEGHVQEVSTEAINGNRIQMIHMNCPACGRRFCEAYRLYGLAEETEHGFGIRTFEPGAWQYLPTVRDTPEIVCLCGSTRFGEAFDQANYEQTLAGRVVLSIGCVTHSDGDLGITPEQKKSLDLLHFRKIDLADRVLVLNVGGYIGESTTREIQYAQATGTPVDFLEK